MSRPPKLCVYCGQPGSSKEHPWGRWSAEPFGPGHTTNHYVQLYPNPEDPTYCDTKLGALNRPGSPRSQTFKIVCEPCNNGWMSEIQNRAKEALTSLAEGDWSEFGLERQAAVAAWAALFTMTIEHAHKDTVSITFAERDRFRTQRQLSEKWRVAVGTGEFASHYSVGHRAMLVRDTTGSVPDEPSQLSCWDFGQLTIATFYGPEEIARIMDERFLYADMRVISPPRAAKLLKPEPFEGINSWQLLDILTPVPAAPPIISGVSAFVRERRRSAPRND